MHIWLWLYAATEVISYNLSAQHSQVLPGLEFQSRAGRRSSFSLDCSFPPHARSSFSFSTGAHASFSNRSRNQSRLKLTWTVKSSNNSTTLKALIVILMILGLSVPHTVCSFRRLHCCLFFTYFFNLKLRKNSLALLTLLLLLLFLVITHINLILYLYFSIYMHVSSRIVMWYTSLLKTSYKM